MHLSALPSRCRIVLGFVALLEMSAGVAWAQQTARANEGPRFLLARADRRAPVETTPSQVPFLGSRVTLRADGISLKQVLAGISRQTGVAFVYGPDIVCTGCRINLRAEDLTLAAVLTEVLFGTGVDVLVTGRRQVTLVLTAGARATQSGSLTGRVTDAKTGALVPGADIFLEKTRWRASTDTSGRYRLAEVDTGHYTLTARRLGYAKQSRSVVVREGPMDTVDLALEPMAARLDELVTTATGSRRRLELGNDITTINADSLVRAEPIRNVTQLLEGRVPGLTVQHTSGAPGDPSRLRLRGAGSPRLNNDPIVVVDGIRIYAQQSSGRNANLATIGDTSYVGEKSYATPSPLDNIDPNSIESVEVLKGPSAATLYGEDAANGVIVITTKKGKAGPTRWAFSADYAQDRIAGKFPDLVVRWGEVLAGGPFPIFCPITNSSSSGGYSILCLGDSVVTFQLLNDPALTPLARAHRAAGALTASGGSSTLTYAVTANYQDQTGLPKLPEYEAARYQARVGAAPPDWMRRPQHLTGWGATSNVTARLGSKADLSLLTSLQRTVQQRSSMEQELGTLMTIYVDKASGCYYNPDRLGDICPPSTDLLTRYFRRVMSRGTAFRNAADFSWRPSTVFALTANAGLDVQTRDDEILQPSWVAPEDTVGEVSAGHGTTVTSTLNLRGNVREVRLPLGARFRFAMGIGFNGTSIRDQNLHTDYLAKGTTLLGGRVTGGHRNLEDQANFRWYAEPAVGFHGFWFTTALQLQQVGNTYGTAARSFLQNLKNQLRFPPTFHTSLLLSDQAFFPFKDLFQTFRVRAAFGRAGRQPGPADRVRLYGETQSNWVDGGFGATVVLASLGNTELRPERSTEIEGGLDADLLDNALSVSLTSYRKTTNDMILFVPLPPSVSVPGSVPGRASVPPTIQKNVGNLRNTGMELQVVARFLRHAPVGLETELQISQHRSLLLAMAPGVQPFYITTRSGFGSGNNDGGARVAAGYPLFGRWSKPIIGYGDGNEDGVLQPSEIFLGDTAVFVGQTEPNYTATLRTAIHLFHRAVVVSAGFLYDDGLSQYNTLTSQLAPFSVGRNLPGASLAEQLASSGSTYSSIQTVSTFRFNSLAINYTVPPTLARRLGAQSLTVGVQGANLGLWTSYRGLDPNVNAFATGNDVMDTGILPQPRTWQVRLSANY